MLSSSRTAHRSSSAPAQPVLPRDAIDTQPTATHDGAANLGRETTLAGDSPVLGQIRSGSDALDDSPQIGSTGCLVGGERGAGLSDDVPEAKLTESA